MSKSTGTITARSYHLEDLHDEAKSVGEYVPDSHHGIPDEKTQQILAAHLDEDERRARNLRWKIDFRVTFFLALVYIWQGIDKGNLGNANIAGMNKDLKLNVDNRYSVVTMIFFITYIIADIPAVFLTRRIGPHITIPGFTFAFGVVTIGQGFLHSWGALIPCRLLLGAFEGALISACIFMIGVWYERYEAHLRFAMFYVIGVASGGFSGLLDFGIENMDGDAGLAGWRWIFIIEGVVTCACAMIAFVFLVGLPGKRGSRGNLRWPPFLTDEEEHIVLARIERDRGDSNPEEIGMKVMLRHLRDWKVWEFASYVALNNIGLYMFSFFLPVILKDGFNYSTSKAQLYTFPPYAIAMPYMLLVAWFCDRMKIRGPVMVFNSSMYILGVCLIGFVENVHARYGGVFIGVMAMAANIPSNFAYQHNNTVGQSKRALCAAMMTVGGACGGLIAGNVFRAQDAPDYIPGLSVCIGAQVIAILLVSKNFFIFYRANMKAKRGEILIEDQPGFRYTY